MNGKNIINIITVIILLIIFMNVHVSVGFREERYGNYTIRVYNDANEYFKHIYNISLSEPLVTITVHGYRVDVYYWHPEYNNTVGLPGTFIYAAAYENYRKYHTCSPENYERRARMSKLIERIFGFNPYYLKSFIRKNDKILEELGFFEIEDELNRYAIHKGICSGYYEIWVSKSDVDRAVYDAKRLADVLDRVYEYYSKTGHVCPLDRYRYILIIPQEYGFHYIMNVLVPKCKLLSLVNNILDEMHANASILWSLYNAYCYIEQREDGVPLLTVNTTLYLRMANMSLEDSKVVAERLGRMIAEALYRVDYPAKHVAIHITYTRGPMIVHQPEIVLKRLDETSENSSSAEPYEGCNAECASMGGPQSNNTYTQANTTNPLLSGGEPSTAMNDRSREDASTIYYFAILLIPVALLAVWRMFRIGK